MCSELRTEIGQWWAFYAERVMLPKQNKKCSFLLFRLFRWIGRVFRFALHCAVLGTEAVQVGHIPKRSQHILLHCFFQQMASAYHPNCSSCVCVCACVHWTLDISHAIPFQFWRGRVWDPHIDNQQESRQHTGREYSKQIMSCWIECVAIFDFVCGHP